MSKFHKIRWRKSDNETLKRLVKNFNAKIDYHEKKNPSNHMPDKIKLRDIKNSIASRNDFNRIVKDLEKFSKRGMETVVENEHGQKATIWEIETTKKNVQRLNRQRAKEQKQIDERPVYIDGKKAPTVRRMVKEQKNKPLEFDFNNTQDFKSYAKYVEQKISDTRHEIEARVYLQVLIDTLHSCLSKEHASILIDLCKRVGGEKLLDLYYLGYEEVTPDFYYDKLIPENDRFLRGKTVLEKAL
nr:MAG TPA: terminal protein [Caudoviricetes sp.]